MKILQLCNKPPYPPVDGGTMAMNSVTKGLLSNGHDVKVLSVCSKKHPVILDRIDPEYKARTKFEAVEIDLSIHPLDAAVAMLCGESYHVKRYIDKNFEKKLTEILDSEEFDIVHIESVFLTPYVATIRRHSDACVVLRAHNVEYNIWQQMSKECCHGLKRWYLKKLALALRVYETEHLNDYDGIVCITDEDAEIFKKSGCRKPITGIPFGITLKETEQTVETPGTLFHIGSMDWMPNDRSIRWFLKEVWPILHEELPAIKLYLAGRKMPDDLMDMKLDGVTVLGEVDDATQFMAGKQINIVPLLAGSGIRIKIIEAMALGKTVISTHVGAAGIRYTDGKNLLIADTPQEFISHIRRCTEDEEYCKSIGKNAIELIKKEYDNNILTQRFIDFYNKIQKKELF